MYSRTKQARNALGNCCGRGKTVNATLMPSPSRSSAIRAHRIATRCAIFGNGRILQVIQLPCSSSCLAKL
ncbi:hypothetical protein VYU27_004791 [Nannochloropsis oceanica]